MRGKGPRGEMRDGEKFPAEKCARGNVPCGEMREGKNLTAEEKEKERGNPPITHIQYERFLPSSSSSGTVN